MSIGSTHLMNTTMPASEINGHRTHLQPPLGDGRKSFDSSSSIGDSHSYRSSVSSFSETLPSDKHTPHLTTMQNREIYTFNLPETYRHSRRNIHVQDSNGTEILYAKVSEHNPLKPDIQFFSNSSCTSQIGHAKFRHGKNLNLVLGDGEEKEMHNVSKDRTYCFYLPSSGTSRKVLWKRTNAEGGGGQTTGKGNRALRYELSDEGSGEVLAVYDEGEEGKTQLLERGKLAVGPELKINGTEGGGMWVLMGALGICEKARRRANKARGGIGSSSNVRVL